MKSLLDEFKKNLQNSKLIDIDPKLNGSMIWLPEGMIIKNLFIELVRKVCLKYHFDEYFFPTITLRR